MFEDEDESPAVDTNYCPYQQRRYPEYGTASRRKLKAYGFHYISYIVYNLYQWLPKFFNMKDPFNIKIAYRPPHDSC